MWVSFSTCPDDLAEELQSHQDLQLFIAASTKTLTSYLISRRAKFVSRASNGFFSRTYDADLCETSVILTRGTQGSHAGLEFYEKVRPILTF